MWAVIVVTVDNVAIELNCFMEIFDFYIIDICINVILVLPLLLSNGSEYFFHHCL